MVQATCIIHTKLSQEDSVTAQENHLYILAYYFPALQKPHIYSVTVSEEFLPACNATIWIFVLFVLGEDPVNTLAIFILESTTFPGEFQKTRSFCEKQLLEERMYVWVITLQPWRGN